MRQAENQLKAEVADLRARIFEIQSSLEQTKAEFAVANRIWLHVDSLPDSLKRMLERKVRSFEFFKLTESDVRAVLEQSRIPASLQVEDFNDLAAKWIASSDEIGSRLDGIDRVGLQKNDPSVEMLVSQLGFSVYHHEMGDAYPGDVFGVLQPLLHLFREKRSSFEESELISIVRSHKLWDQVDWPQEQLQRLAHICSEDLARLHDLELQLKLILQDSPDRGPDQEVLGCIKTSGDNTSG
jgi:hypothetical protein